MKYTNKDIEIGKYYRLEFYSSKDNTWHIKIKNKNKKGDVNGPHFDTSNDYFYASELLGNISDVTNVRELNNNEIRHLEACEKAEKFVSYDDVKTEENYEIF